MQGVTMATRYGRWPALQPHQIRGGASTVPDRLAFQEERLGRLSLHGAASSRELRAPTKTSVSRRAVWDASCCMEPRVPANCELRKKTASSGLAQLRKKLRTQSYPLPSQCLKV